MASAAPVARQGITHHATQCEDALRLAEIAAGMRKLAAIHAKDAWAWVRHLGKPRASA